MNSTRSGCSEDSISSINLPQPFLRYRNPKNPDDLRAGDVVAYRRKRDGYYSTGVMIIADRNMFLVATNWSYDGELWYNDIIDYQISLYEANDEEISWASRFLFN